MNNYVVSEATLHYAAAFIERWAEKAPNQEHAKAAKELRGMSNYLLENLYAPTYMLVVRHERKK